jgi:hypothetical protein
MLEGAAGPHPFSLPLNGGRPCEKFYRRQFKIIFYVTEIR